MIIKNCGTMVKPLKSVENIMLDENGKLVRTEKKVRNIF